MMKTFYGDHAQRDNDWGFSLLPKWDKPYDVLQYFEMMDKGEVNGYICQGFNPVASFPNKNKSDPFIIKTEIPYHHGSAKYRNILFLAKPR